MRGVSDSESGQDGVPEDESAQGVPEVAASRGGREAGMPPGEPEDDAGQGRELLTRILESVEAGGRPLSAESLVALASMAQAVEGYLPFGLVAGILEEGRLPWREQLTMLSLYQDSDEGETMLEMVRENGLDRGLGVLRVLHAIAGRAEDSEYADDLQQRIQREKPPRQRCRPKRKTRRPRPPQC